MSLAALLATPSSALVHHDPDDARGPLDLATVELKQVEREMVLEVKTRGQFGLETLRRFPDSPNAGGERFLCLKLRGNDIVPALVCPGGPVEEGRIQVGYSRLQGGRAVPERAFRAAVKRPSPSALRLEFEPRQAGLSPGRFHWHVVSGWDGAVCAAPPGQNDPCLDRAPDDAEGYAGQVFRIQRVGCTRSGDDLRAHGSRAKKAVALTFDDGPSSYTGNILRVLHRKEVSGTFYVIGEKLDGRRAVLRKMVHQGHEIGNHSMHHEQYPSSSSMRQTNQKVKRMTGFRPCTFRPPYGAVNSALVNRADDLGMTTVLWDVDTQDYTSPGSGAIESRAVNGARRGSIILMHDGGGNRSQTVNALPGIIKKLEHRGFKLVTVTELLGERFELGKVR